MSVVKHVPCPFCGKSVEVVDTKPQKADGTSLIYLRVKCFDCKANIEAAGVGLGQAMKELDDQLDQRCGTAVEDWKINPNKRLSRRRCRR